MPKKLKSKLSRRARFFHTKNHMVKKKFSFCLKSIHLVLMLLMATSSIASEMPLRCEEAIIGLQTEPFIVSDLQFAAGKIRDIYRRLEFPRLEFPARPIHFSEVQRYLQAFVDYKEKVVEIASRKSTAERKALMKYASFIDQTLQTFTNQYTSFWPTSLVLGKLERLSGNIKGAGFEMLVEILLIRKGYHIDAAGIESQSIRDFYHVIDNVTSTNLEIDFIVDKNGQEYWIEAKNFNTSSDNLFLNKTVEKAIEQIKARVVYRAKLGLQNKVKIISIFHFEIDEALRKKMMAAGADAVISIRKAYLDDYNTYH